MNDKPNRKTRRQEIFFIEKELLSLASRVVKLDATIKRVEQEIEITSAENTDKIRELNEKLARLRMQEQKVGEKYDTYAKQHQDMHDLGDGSSPSILSVLEDSMKPDADSHPINSDSRSTGAH